MRVENILQVVQVPRNYIFDKRILDYIWMSDFVNDCSFRSFYSPSFGSNWYRSRISILF